MSVERLNDKRWLVELASGGFDDVGADRVEIYHGGTLVFTSGRIAELEVAVIYAPGQWLTVVQEADE